MADAVESKRTRRLIFAALGALVLIGVAIADWRSPEPGLLKALVYGTSGLVVTAPVPDAEVLLDGLPVGRTPLDRDDLLAGRHALQVRHPWYLPWVGEIDLPPDGQATKAIEFPAAEGALMIASNPEGAEVRVDGTLLDAPTPTALDPIAAGAHQVELRMFGRQTVLKTVGVPPNERVELVEELATVDTGALVVRTVPANARVRLVDAPVAYARDVRLPVGDYRIEVTAPGFESRTFTHHLRTGPNEVDVTLERREGRLTVNVTPPDATVTVMRDGRRLDYRPGVALPTGTVEVRVRKPGYRSLVRRVSVATGEQQLDLRLERIDAREGEVLRDAMRNAGAGTGATAPAVVVVTGGAPTPFAIGVTEITIAEYSRYARDVGVALPSLKDSGDDHPVAKISWDEAVAYTRWLSESTGHVYRLPTDAEWTLVERRGGAGAGEPCARGNIGDAALNRVFREFDALDCDDGFVRTAPAGRFPANALGVHDLFGNVAEWLSDCGYGGCSTHLARGSAWDSSGAELEPGFHTSSDRAGDTRGFRVVREL